MNRELISRRNRKPMITIIDDDGRTDVLTKWEPILQTKNFKMDIAVLTSLVGSTNFMGWEDLERLKNSYSVDLVNHSHSHTHLGELATEEEVIYEFKTSTDILKARGHTYDVMVYPYGSQNEMVRKVARQYCRAGLHTQGGVVKPPLNTFVLSRQGLMSSASPMGDVTTYTAFIDQAIAENGWIIFMSHSQYSSFDVEKIKEIIDYANSKDIEWVHTREGLDRIGNIIDVGDYDARATGSEYTVLDCDGILYSKSNSKDYTNIPSTAKVTVNTPLTDYPVGLSGAIVQTAEATGFPGNAAGMLETYRASSTAASQVFNYQFYYPYYTNKIYKRYWHRIDEVWSNFEIVMTQSEFEAQNAYVVNNTVNAYSATTPLTDFPDKKITTFAVNESGATGFPDNAAGLVTTYRVYSTNWNKQEFRKYKSNEVWSRWSDAGVWQPWQKISAI